MKTNLNLNSPSCLRKALRVSALLLLAALPSVLAQTTVTSVPADGATSVSASAAVVFTFSAPMNPTSSSAFFQSPPSSFYPVTTVWSAGNTVLTCAPISPFPANTTISWTVAGLDAGSGFVSASGSFSTGTNSGGGGGSGTNAITTLTAGKFYFFDQLTSGASTPSPDATYDFTASASLASNRTATAVTVTVPGAATPLSLQHLDPSHPENFNYFTFSTNQTTFEAGFPQGNYIYNITGTPANLQGTVVLPTTMLQPNAPHVSNFAAAQTVDAAQAFKLNWDAFEGGTPGDFISVSVSDDSGTTVFETPNPGTNGALAGTVSSVTIPAGKLAANTTNRAEIVFYRFVATTNANYVALAVRASGTQFDLITVGAATTVPVVSQPIWSGSGFAFDVATSPNQALKVRFSTDCSLPIAQWQTVLTTNSPGTSVHLVIPAQGGPNGFFRIQNGP